MLGIILSPSASERRVPAQYRLREHSKEKLLIFVEGTVNSGSTEVIEGELYLRLAVGCRDKCKIGKKNIIPIESVKSLESQASDFSLLSPVEIAKRLGADVVLYVLIEKYDLYDVMEGQYCEGSISSRSILFDAGSGEVLWPKSDGGEVARASVDIETRGMNRANARLLSTTTHCILRKLYDCPSNIYKTEAEGRDFYMEGW